MVNSLRNIICFEFCKKLHNSSYVIDIFTSQTDRRNWKEYFEERNKPLTLEERNAFHNTALKFNRIHGLESNFQALEDYYIQNSSLRAEFQRYVDRVVNVNGSIFNELSCDERGSFTIFDLWEPMRKYAWAKEIKQSAYEGLVYLSTFSKEK